MKLRIMTTGALTGALMVGSVWAGAGLAPVRSTQAPELPRVLPSTVASSHAPAADDAELGPDELLVGASKISLEPQPDASKGEVWVRDKAKCTPVTSRDLEATGSHAADWRTPWIENTNCIYMGGYGIGPSNPVLTWDEEYGLWVRTFVFSSPARTDSSGSAVPAGDLVLTVLDAEGYFGDYNKLCGPKVARCGAHELADDLGTELGVAPDSFVIASTHSHTALDLIGGWGGVPAWYMDQVATAIKDSVREAFSHRRPARLEAGESMARAYNAERRDTYRSAEDPTVNWLRAIRHDGDVIATVGTFASHPVSASAGSGVGHADYPAVFAKSVEADDGGIAGLFPAGLGNMSPRGRGSNGLERLIDQGQGLANVLPPAGTGSPVRNPVVRAKREFWDQPITNVPLGSLGAGGFFDRPFGGPASVQAGKSAVKPCTSASAVSVRVSVTAAKIGDLVVTAAPGEIFANFSNTVEERSPITALAIGQANDALGYMPQSFETDNSARQATGFVGANFFEYEDAYSLDHCFGDKALETQLKLLGQL